MSTVRNSPQQLNIPDKITMTHTNGYLNQVWRWLWTSDDRKHVNRNINDKAGAELTEILIEGKALHQQTQSLRVTSHEEPGPRNWKGGLIKRSLVAR